MTWSAKLSELGIGLPTTAAPVGAYVPAIRTGSLVFTSGQIPVVGGSLQTVGKVGAAVSADEAKRCARICGLNALAAIANLVGVDSIVRVIKVVGFVASAEGFTDQAAVLNGASDLFVEIFGPAGSHARSAVGVAELPLGAPVEVEVVVEVS